MDDRTIEDTSRETPVDERDDPATSDANGSAHDQMTDEGAPPPSEPAPEEG